VTNGSDQALAVGARVRVERINGLALIVVPA